MEDGVDTRYVQQLLGHGSIKTTERYTHVSENALGANYKPVGQVGIMREQMDTS